MPTYTWLSGSGLLDSTEKSMTKMLLNVAIAHTLVTEQSDSLTFWRCGESIAVGARGLGFYFRAGQMDTVAPTAFKLCGVSLVLCCRLPTVPRR